MVWLEHFSQDLRHGCRVFAKHPAFTAIAVISIAFGTGANVAMFSTADALLFRPLPIARPRELVTVGSKVRLGPGARSGASYADYADIRDRSTSFSGLVAYTSRPLGFSPQPGASPHLRMVTIASANFFQVLGVEPEIGRGFRADEDRVPGRDAVTVLSHGAWQKEFGGDPAVLGRTIRIADIEFTVIGVAPERFTGIEPRFAEAAYVPLAMWPKLMGDPPVNPLESRAFRGLTLKGRLASGVTMGGARAELSAIASDLERAHPDTNAGQTLAVQTEYEFNFERRPLDSGLLVLLTTLSIAVLSVACANVAALLASRAPVRAREIALRLAIGASRPRLVRQLITESLAIAAAGGLGGIAVGYAGIVLLRRIQYPTDIIVAPAIELDERTLAFSVGIAVASALLFGLGPALQTTRVHLVHALKASDGGGEKRLRLGGRNILVALQVAISLVLLTIAVYAFQVFRGELTSGPGFRTARMAKASVDPSQARYTTAEAARFFERAVENTRRLPGVRSATVASAVPLFSLESVPIVPEGFDLPEGQTAMRSLANTVGEDYFETMEIPIVAGRAFRATDTADAPRVAIVNETLARRCWPDGDAVGRRLRVSGQGPWVEVVGIARTSRYLYFAEPPQDMTYFPFRQDPRGSMALLAQTAGESAALLPPLRATIQRMDAHVPVYDVQTMEAFYAARVTDIGDVLTSMIGGLGAMGLTLTMVGLYGLVSYAVSRRTREIGIRIAVGATEGRVLRMVLQQGMLPVLCGLAAGLASSIVTNRLLPRIVPVARGFDARTFLLVVPTLLAVTLVAAYLPARRAARVDPTIALRSE